MDWLGLLVFIAYIIFTLAVIVSYFHIKNNNKVLLVSNAQLLLDRNELLKKLEQSMAINNGIEKTDGFLKFISESRDWAFTYIENVQQAISDYDVALSSNNAKLINESYNKLVDFLPKDNMVS